MPTPQGPRSSYALNGTAPGLTWDQFLANFTAPTDSKDALVGGTISALGPYGIQASRTANVVGGEGQSGDTDYGDKPWDQFKQDLPDGTSNYYMEGPNDSVQAVNQTSNADSWWDSTGLPLVASLAFGGATAGLSAAGVGASAADAAGQGLVNVGAGFGSSSGATGLASSTLGAAASAVPTATNDIASAGYNPFNPSNWTADAGTAASDASAAAPEASTSLWDQAQALAKQYGFGNGPIGSVQNIVNGTGGIGDYLSAGSNLNSLSSLAQDLGHGATQAADGTLDYSGFQPTSVDTSQFGNSAANTILQNGGFSTPTSGSTNPFQAISNLYNNGIFNGSPSDYLSLAGAGSSLLSGILGNSAANKAANAQIGAANNSNALAASIYANNTALNAPFVGTGTGAVGKLGNLYGLNGAAAQTQAQNAFQTSPGYQFRLDQGTKALQNSASAAGGLYSGRAAKDLTNYAQGAASGEYGNYTNGLSNLANLGESAANQQAQNGNNLVANTTSNNASIGNAGAAGTISSTNAITGSISSYLNNLGGNQLLQQLLRQNNGYYPIS